MLPVFDLEFRHPWFLLAAVAAILVYYLLARRRAAAVMYSSLSLPDAAPRSLRVRISHLPAILFSLATLAMTIALAGPRTPDDQTHIRSEGIAIMMVVDRSGSMDARDLVKGDVQVNRLEVVKSVFKRFVLGDEAGDDALVAMHAGRGRGDDLVGLIAFARYADGLCPLTLDHGNLVNILDDLEIVTQRNEDGTALGEGLALAVEKLRQQAAKSKVLILLTDGVNNAGDISPQQAAELARRYGIKVYAIGAGTTGWAPVPAVDPFTGRQAFQRARVEIDEQTLKEIADKCDGRYFRATDAQALAQVYQQIDELERSEITELRYLQYHEWYGAFILTAISMIAVAAVSAGTIFRTLP